MGQALFPLDEELGLLPGKYTPLVQESMTRLGSKMPFGQAVEEIWYSHRNRVEEATVRSLTHRCGAIAEAIVKTEVERLEKEAPTAKTPEKQLLLSSDGAFIHLTNGEWREVKTMVVGAIDREWDYKQSEVVVRTGDISYFSRTCDIRNFERYALAELHERGIENAPEVVAVNDGSGWIQSFIDYHAPQATRIIDFAHALSYVAEAGKAVLGEGTARFNQWLDARAHQLKHEPPQQTLRHLALLCCQATTDEQLAVIDHARRYLLKREAMIDYAHWQRRGLPIGSGSVESSHKVVVHQRLKQAGMRWAPAHVDPLLALRNLICNGRWEQGWTQIIDFYWQQKRQKNQPTPTEMTKPITFADVKVAPQKEKAPPLTIPPNSAKSNRPAEDHPWRQGLWPTREAWRWN